MKPQFLRSIACVLLIAFPVFGPVASGEESQAKPAEISIKGVGWLKGRDLRQTLRMLEPEGSRMEFVNASFVEDAIVLLQSAMETDGYLRSTGSVEVFTNGSSDGVFEWEMDEIPVLPRGIQAHAAVFRLKPGVRYWFHAIESSGLEPLAEIKVENYFIEEGLLLGGDSARMFTPGKFKNGVSNLKEQLFRMGYSDAVVDADLISQDDKSGAVDVRLDVTLGPLHRVGEVIVSGSFPDDLADKVRTRAAEANGAVFSLFWRQDFVQSYRSLFFENGYPSVEVDLETAGQEHKGSETIRAMRLEIQSGPQVRIGEVKFVGDVKTKDNVMRRSVGIKSGELFRRNVVEEGRIRLGALGAFSSVRTEAEPVEDDVWNLEYLVRPSKKLDLSLLAGWGSYEQLRGGVELKHGDLMGMAHRGRLQLIQSMKSSTADYLYTMPQFFGSKSDGSVRAFGLLREEVSFERQEVGASFGFRRRLDFIKTDAGLRYQYESVQAVDFTGDPNEAPTDSRVGTIILDLTKDRLDNPVSPKKGYLASGAFETAGQWLGGDVNYERIELGVSWHRPIGSQTYVHIGLHQGLIWGFGESFTEIPLARRFFPGGEDTIRGYGEGEASPRDANGNQIGAETVTILNLELEKAITRQFSGVVFVDAGIMGAELDSFPGDEQRVSVGAGLRLNTVIGPVRLEYGYNVVREPGDEKDHIHFALGFPF